MAQPSPPPRLTPYDLQPVKPEVAGLASGTVVGAIGPECGGRGSLPGAEDGGSGRGSRGHTAAGHGPGRGSDKRGGRTVKPRETFARGREAGAVVACVMFAAVAIAIGRRAGADDRPPRPVVPPSVSPPGSAEEVLDAADAELVARLRGLAAVGALPDDELATVVGALEHRAGRVRAAAAAVLRSHEDVAVQYVRARLSHPEAAARRAALLVVQALGPAGQAFVFETIELVSDPEMGVCNAASYALQRVGPLDDGAALRIVRELPRRSPRWRARALELLVSAEPATPGERPWVGEAFAWLVATSPAPDELPGRLALLRWAARSPTWGERADAHLVGMLRANDAATWIGVLGALEATKRPLAASHVPSIVALLRDSVTHERAIDVLRRRVAGLILASNLAASDDPAVRTGRRCTTPRAASGASPWASPCATARGIGTRRRGSPRDSVVRGARASSSGPR
jgi:hypothetical protein